MTQLCPGKWSKYSLSFYIPHAEIADLALYVNLEEWCRNQCNLSK